MDDCFSTNFWCDNCHALKEDKEKLQKQQESDKDFILRLKDRLMNVDGMMTDIYAVKNGEEQKQRLLTGLEDQIKAQALTISRKESELCTLTTQRDAAYTERESLQKERDHLLRKCSRLEQDRDRYKSQVEAFHVEHSQTSLAYKGLEADCNRLREELKDYRSNIKKQETFSAKHKEDIEKYKRTISELRKRITYLERHFSTSGKIHLAGEEVISKSRRYRKRGGDMDEKMLLLKMSNMLMRNEDISGYEVDTLIKWLNWQPTRMSPIHSTAEDDDNESDDSSNDSAVSDDSIDDYADKLLAELVSDSFVTSSSSNAVAEDLQPVDVSNLKNYDKNKLSESRSSLSNSESVHERSDINTNIGSTKQSSLILCDSERSVDKSASYETVNGTMSRTEVIDIIAAIDKSHQDVAAVDKSHDVTAIESHQDVATFDKSHQDVTAIDKSHQYVTAVDKSLTNDAEVEKSLDMLLVCDTSVSSTNECRPCPDSAVEPELSVALYTASSDQYATDSNKAQYKEVKTLDSQKVSENISENVSADNGGHVIEYVDLDDNQLVVGPSVSSAESMTAQETGLDTTDCNVGDPAEDRTDSVIGTAVDDSEQSPAVVNIENKYDLDASSSSPVQQLSIEKENATNSITIEYARSSVNESHSIGGSVIHSSKADLHVDEADADSKCEQKVMFIGSVCESSSVCNEPLVLTELNRSVAAQPYEEDNLLNSAMQIKTPELSAGDVKAATVVCASLNSTDVMTCKSAGNLEVSSYNEGTEGTECDTIEDCDLEATEKSQDQSCAIADSSADNGEPNEENIDVKLHSKQDFSIPYLGNTEAKCESLDLNECKQECLNKESGLSSEKVSVSRKRKKNKKRTRKELKADHENLLRIVDEVLSLPSLLEPLNEDKASDDKLSSDVIADKTIGHHLRRQCRGAQLIEFGELPPLKRRKKNSNVPAGGNPMNEDDALSVCKPEAFSETSDIDARPESDECVQQQACNDGISKGDTSSEDSIPKIIWDVLQEATRSPNQSSLSRLNKIIKCNPTVDQLASLLFTAVLINAGEMSDILYERCMCGDTPDAEPWLSSVELVLIHILSGCAALPRYNGLFKNFSTRCLSALSDSRLKASASVTISRCAICRVYVSICRLQGDAERVRVLVTDCVKYKFSELLSVILSVMSVWPQPLRCQPDNENDEEPLLQVLQYVICSDKPHKDPEQASKMLMCIGKLCGWRKRVHDAEQLASHLINKLEICSTKPSSHQHDEGWNIISALELLSVEEGCEWTNDCLVVGLLWSKLTAILSDITNIPLFLENIISLLGYVVRHCAVTPGSCAEQTTGLLLALLADGSVSMRVKQTSLRALMLLTDVDRQTISDTVITWITSHFCDRSVTQHQLDPTTTQVIDSFVFKYSSLCHKVSDFVQVWTEYKTRL